MSDGEILEMLLKEKNISIRDLAAKANIPEQTLYSMKKRKNNRTGNEIKAKISKALNVSAEIWNSSKDELIINENADTFIDKESFYRMLNLKNRNETYIKYALDFLGYHYTLEEIRKIISGSLPVEPKLASAVKYILLNDSIISHEELDMICRIRCLSKKSRDYLEETIKNLIKVDTYENYEIKTLQQQLSHSD